MPAILRGSTAGGLERCRQRTGCGELGADIPRARLLRLLARFGPRARPSRAFDPRTGRGLKSVPMGVVEVHALPRRRDARSSVRNARRCTTPRPPYSTGWNAGASFFIGLM